MQCLGYINPKVNFIQELLRDSGKIVIGVGPYDDMRDLIFDA
jgi:hypothetical protein